MRFMMMRGFLAVVVNVSLKARIWEPQLPRLEQLPVRIEWWQVLCRKSTCSPNLVLISPTFYEQLFCTKVWRAAFLYLHCRFVLFGTRKLAQKLLIKCRWNWHLVFASRNVPWQEYRTCSGPRLSPRTIFDVLNTAQSKQSLCFEFVVFQWPTVMALNLWYASGIVHHLSELFPYLLWACFLQYGNARGSRLQPKRVAKQGGVFFF